MKQCKNCIHFSVSEKEYPFGQCNNNKFVYDDHGAVKEDDCLVYCDYEGYSAGFQVGINFGCIHFEDNGCLMDMVKVKLSRDWIEEAVFYTEDEIDHLYEDEVTVKVLKSDLEWMNKVIEEKMKLDNFLEELYNESTKSKTEGGSV